MKQLSRIFLLSIFLLSLATGIFAQPSILEVTTTPALCNGSPTGSVSFAITGGTKPYYYSIFKDGVTTTSPVTTDTVYTFLNVGSGLYFCFVTDANSLVDSRTRSVSQPAPISITSVNVTPITCTGFDDGIITLTAAGESGSYNFLLLPDNISTTTGIFEDRSPGNYTVQVSDATGCSTTATTAVLVLSDPVPISIVDQSSSNISCNGANDGSISITASGGTGVLTYTITPGGTTNTTGAFNNLSPDTYTVEITDTESCPSAMSLPITISEPGILQFSSQLVADVSCNGANDGSINVTASGGTAPYTFTLSPGGATSATGDFTGLQPGTYSVSLTDAQSCGPVSIGSLVITQPAPILITNTSISQINCHNSNNGEISVTASGGNAPLTYTLNPGNIPNLTGVFSGLSAGTYTITVSDSKACNPATTAPITITNPDPITITGSAHTDISCNGASDGTITVTASGGTGALSYTIVPGPPTGQATGNFTGLGANTYTVFVTDQNSCPPVPSLPITISEPDLLVLNILSVNNISCNGANDGSISTTATGGVAPYLFTLSPGGATSATGDFANLLPGTYSVSLTDAGLCGPVTIGNLVITQPAPILITNTSISQITCHNSNNGEISVTATGGNAPLTYTLNPGNIPSLTGIFSGLSAGTYTVTVSDAKACTPASTAPITITNPDPITITGSAHSDISCNGASDGIITVTASGGTGALVYAIVPGPVTGQASGNFTGLEANTYTVFVTDQNSCPAVPSLPITISEPDLLVLNVQTVTDVSCNGANDGSISTTATGGVAPYLFTLSPEGATSATGDFTGLQPGTYSVSLTDAGLCGPVSIGSLVITQPDPILITNTSISQITCHNSNNGEISVTATGGNAPLTYTLNPGNIPNLTGVFSGLSAGTYTITVSDPKSCTPATTAPITITNPDPIAITGSAHTDISCNGASDGTITVTASGGTGALSYAIVPGPLTEQASGNFTGLGPNTYTVWVSDQNSCPPVTSVPITISEPDLLVLNVQTITHVSCNGANDGSISTTATGGVVPYVFTLSPGGATSATGDFTGLQSGTYSVSLTDAASCGPVSIGSLVITQPDPIIITNTSISQISCHNSNDGEISVSAAGGNAPLTYTLNPGNIPSPTGVFSGLSAGTYTISVSDTEACTPATTAPLTITNPDPIAITGTVYTDISCFGENDGTITVTASGGTGALSYTIVPGSITPQASGNFTGLGPDIYQIIVEDQNLCPNATSLPITISEPAALNTVVDGSSKLTVNCFGGSDGAINVTVTGGTAPYSYSWTGPVGFTSSLEDISGLLPGIYNLTVTDSRLCTSVHPGIATITEPPQLDISLSKSDITCYGFPDGSITVSASGGTGSYQYSRNGIVYQPSNVFSGLSENTYTIWVRDSNSCLVSDTISIDEPNELLINSEISISENKCFGDSLGEIRILNVSGGSQPYEYSINGGLSFSSSPVFLNLPGGSYPSVVRDSRGCSTPGSVHIISQPAPLRITNYSPTDISTCSYNLNGQIVIEGTGGTGIKRYSLDGGLPNTTGIFTALGGGSHYIAITDNNNCLIDTTVFLDFPVPLEFNSFLITHVTGCGGGTNGAISALAEGGAGTYSYSLNGSPFQPSGDFSGLAAGNYTLIIRDANNCEKDSLFSVTEPAALGFNSITSTDLSCSGTNDGSITAIAEGGTGPFSFLLDPIGTVDATGIFTGLPGGTYTISLTDAAGCGPVVSTPVTINEPDPILVDSVKYTNITCNGSGNGDISIYAQGGTGALSYSIDNGVSFSSNSTFSGLAPGTYFLRVQDMNSCTRLSDTLQLTEPPALTVVTENAQDVSTCAGESTGALNFEVSGGTGTIQYSQDGFNWLGSGVFTNLPAGSYTILARDELNCILSSSNLLISEPQPITADVSTTLYKDEFNKGSISILNPSGGTGNLEFSIIELSIPFSSQTVFNDLDEGPYTVVIRDQNNCMITRNVTVSALPPLEVNVTFTDINCHGSGDGSITLEAVNPYGPVEYSIDDSASWQAENTFTSLAQGLYRIVVRDSAERYFTSQVSIYEPSAINIMGSVNKASCNAFSPDGSVILNVAGGTGAMTYLWDDGSTAKDRSNLNSGSYTVTVTDENGCLAENTIVVSSEITVDANAGADTSVCEGTLLTLNGQGGTDASWFPATGLSNPNIFNPVVTITESVSYVLTASGMNDCYDVDTITINVYPKLGLNAGNDTSVLENNLVNLLATGGPYVSYLWEPSAGLDDPESPGPVATLATSRMYIVTVVDGNGCVEKDTVAVHIIEKLNIYNSFSPNDDGVNDHWDIEYGDLYPDMVVEVYTRWGEKLFSSKGYTDEKRWDGYYKGKKVPIGTYYYVVIPYKGAKAITGPLTIVR